jgi:RND family efflux transporter MFP subunit
VQNLEFSGTIEPSQTIPLSFRTPGTVEKVLVEEGDFVKKGQLLATIDETDARNLYEMSASKYEQAADAYERLKSVYDKGSLAEIKWVEMETNLQQAKSSLELSKNNLGKCKLFSPANGIIGIRNIEPGMSAINITGTPLEIVDIKTVNIKIPIPENEISKIKKGLVANITVSALGNKKYEGIITNVSQVADKFSRTYDAKILVTNTDYELKPGMVCDVKLNIQLDEFSVLVPYQSVSEDSDGNTFVYLIDATNKRAKKQIVKTGNFVGSDIEIISGLTEGQEVVCKGNNKLMDNSLITW